MKTAVSLPDEVFESAERMARRLGKSRSEVYRLALAEFLARHEPDAVTDALDQVVSQVGSTSDDFGREASRRVLAESEW